MCAMANREYDKIVGRNLAGLRGDRSQQMIADEMRKRGHRWTQATVWAIEKGERSLKLEEAIALSEVVEVNVLSIAGWGEEHGAHFMRAGRRLSEAHSGIARLAQEFTRTAVQTSTESILLDDEGQLPDEPLWWLWMDVPIRDHLIEAVDSGMRAEAKRSIVEDYSESADLDRLVAVELDQAEALRLEARKRWKARRGEHREAP